MPKNIFSPEFKRECTELAIVHSYKHKAAAVAMSVGLSSIQCWNSYKNRPTTYHTKSSTLSIVKYVFKSLKKASSC